jgi:uncharacterized membrane protein YfcA
MDIIWLALVAFGASLLTFFSGFGLGTLLLPAMLLYFPPELAVALTAVVHLSSNLFKGILLGRQANVQVLLKFGVPAMFAAWLGAWLLGKMTPTTTWFEWRWQGMQGTITPLKIIIATIMIAFALLELWPRFQRWQLDAKWMPMGGLLSGFFGGLSGHQGALRSAFLMRTKLTKEVFIATGVVIAIGIDISRITVYTGTLSIDLLDTFKWVLLVATAAAMLGVWLGRRLLKKVTMQAVQRLAAVMLVVIALLLATGLI